jgi:predicted ribosome quality control (RQC) complex YloA/Tae2 family protein
LLSFTIHAHGKTEALIVSTLPQALDLAIVGRRPKGERATPSISSLRRHVVGARVAGVERSRRAIRITLVRGEDPRFLIATPAKPYGAWWLTDDSGEIVVRSPGSATSPPDETGHWAPEQANLLRSRGRDVLDVHREARLRQLERGLARELKRVRAKKAAIGRDLERAQQAETFQEWANLLLAHAHAIPEGATSFEAPSFEDPDLFIEIPLSADRPAAEEAQALFAKAKRLKRGMAVIPGRLEAVNQRLAQLEALETELKNQSPAAAVATLTKAGIAVEEPRERERKKRRAGARLPYREFVSHGDTSVLVGRGAAENDRLTLRVARPHDLWLHARGVTGAHVVVRLEKNQACPPEVLVDAATLSAHFSELRGEAVVDVLYTPRRFVRKPKGSPVGSVTLEREKVIAVRVEPTRLERLLGTERRTGR